MLEEKFLRNDFETNVMSDQILLAHLTQRVMWGIIITWPPMSSVNLYILIFFSETTGQIATNLVGIFNKWSPTKFMFFVDQKYTKERKDLNVSKMACSYIWVYIIYCSFVFYEDFYNAFRTNISFGNMHNAWSKMDAITVSRNFKWQKNSAGIFLWNLEVKLKTMWAITCSQEPLVLLCSIYQLYCFICRYFLGINDYALWIGANDLKKRSEVDVGIWPQYNRLF